MQKAIKNGTTLKGTYKIIDTISLKGGTGITYKAKNIFDGEVVAIKEFFPDRLCTRGDGNNVCPNNNPIDIKEFNESLVRFKHEASVLKNNGKEGVTLKFYDVFEANMTVYYVMEYLQGISLGDYLVKENRPISIDKTLELLRPIFDSLITCHEVLSILHRDISPDNIFICDNGRVRLIDFGNAHTMEKGMSQVRDWHKVGYSPAEQEGGSQRQGTWTDVYSMAATVYRCITGKDPIAAESRMDYGRSEGERDRLIKPRLLNPSIPLSVEAILLDALAYDYVNRTKTIRELRNDLYGIEEMPATSPHTASMVSGITEEEVSSKLVTTGKLIGLEGKYQGREFLLSNSLTFGRSPMECQIVFDKDAPGVSRVHCKVYWDDNKQRALLEDLGSTYGTRTLGGLKIKRDEIVEISEGEGFIIGDNEVFALVIEKVKKF